MAIFGPNADSIAFTVLLMVLPSLINRARGIYQGAANKQPAARAPAQTLLLRSLSFLVIAHLAYILYTIFFDAPSNIFTALDLPLTTSPLAMRLRLSSFAPDDDLPPKTEALLARLQSVDVRGYYVRFGHDAVAQCDWCHSMSDFGLFSAPTAGLQYVRTIALIGLMTIPGSGKRGWRGWAVGAIVAAGLAEAWTLATIQVVIGQNSDPTPMWHDRFWYCRQLFFLLLPLALHILPYNVNAQAGLQLVPFALNSVESTLSSLYVLDAVRRASLRDDELRGRVSEYYQHDALTSRLAHRDEEIREEAERAGLALPGTGDSDETGGQMVASVRNMVQQWKGTLLGLLQSASSPPPPPTTASAPLTRM